MSYIGLDVGTSGCKAAVISTDGVLKYSADAQYAFSSPQPGYVELDPQIVWTSVINVLKEISPFAADANTIAVSSIGESMVILDKEDRILYNGIVYLDQRCTDTLALIESQISPQELHHITGVSANQMFTLNKFLWFRKHAPEVLEKADKFFLFGDYITYMLCGARAIDPGSASRTMFFDARSLRWSQTIGNLFELPLDKFSDITAPGTKLGPLRTSLAEELRLPKSLTVITGIHDQCAATLGSGSLSPGELMMGQGSTESINCVIHKDQISESLVDHQICFEPYVDADHYIIITGNLTHGSSINWFTRSFYTPGAQEPLDYTALYDSLPQSSGTIFFLPYLSKVNLMDAKNLALGGFLGIDVTATRPQMFRALLEGLCYETRVSLDIFKSVDVDIKRITASGGVSKSSVYMQMKSDIINFPIHILKNPQAGIMGLGMIGAVSVGDYCSYEDASKVFAESKEVVYSPEKNYHSKYEDYLLVSRHVKDLYRRLEHGL